MRDAINVRKDDILWQFYCKRFTIENREIEKPKNLCRYFWTSVKGFGLWLSREVRLYTLWLIGLIATAMLFAVIRFFPSPKGNIPITVVCVIVAVIWYVTAMAPVYVTMIRISRVLRARAPWTIYLFGFSLMTLLIVYEVRPGAFGPELQEFFRYLLRWMGYAFVILISLTIITIFAGIIAGVISKAPNHRLEKLQRVLRVLETFGALISAKKSKVCPPINPPEGFDTRH